MVNDLRTKFGILEAEIKTTYHVTWFTCYDKTKNSLNSIFNKAYDKKDMEMLESPNDTYYNIDVKKEELSEWDKKTLESIIKNSYFECYYLRIILTDLANKDIIPQGTYSVFVSW